MKRFIAIIAIVFVMMTMMVPAFAASDVRTGIADSTTTSTSNTNSATSTSNGWNYGIGNIESELGIQNVSTDDLINKINDKGSGIITLIQIAGRYIVVGVFIISCVVFIIGILGNKKLMWGGIFGAIFSGAAYAAITYGPEIVAWIAAYAAS